MAIRRLIAIGAVVGLLLVAATPVAAHAGQNRYAVNVLVTGPTPDADLVNGWGISRLAASPWWVADNGTDSSTLYRADGSKVPLKVAIPGFGDLGGTPTGTVSSANAGDFNGDVFLFDSEAGVISGWRGSLGQNAEVGNDDHAGDAVYKGLAIGTADVGSGMQTYLYATDFHNGRIDVFDNAFGSQTWSGAFVDPNLPAGYAPFGIQNLNGWLFVTYAKTQPGSDDELAGAGLGVVDMYLTDGTFLGRVATGGGLNAPWGLAWAPSHFGHFSGDLLVGNFGDGSLHAYRWNGQHWHAAGALKGANHQPIRVDGLWGIAFGGGTDNNGPVNTLFFAAGPNDEEGGAFGTITAAP
jgi:uncharacterized protein (TIGR03118 family)